MHAQQNFAGTDFWNGNGFEPDVIYAAVNGGKHGSRNSMGAIVDGELSGNTHYGFDES